MAKFVEEIITRVVVTSLLDALPIYSKLSGQSEARYVDFPQYRAAVVGGFMLIEGSADRLGSYSQSPVLAVGDLVAALETFTRHGGQVLDGPNTSVHGVHATVADCDGNVFECLQPTST